MKKNAVQNLMLFINIFVAAFFLFSSCSTDEANVTTASGIVIFDYKNKTSYPQTRLGIYIQTQSAPQRADYFTATNEETGWIWDVYNPEKYEDNSNRRYVFCDSIYAPAGSVIPQGIYNVEYFDAGGKSSQAVFRLLYNKELLSKKAEASVSLLENKTENIAIYDDQQELLYFGSKKSTWANNKSILRDYKVAHSKRMCYVNSLNTVMIMMPPELLNEGE